MKSYPRFVLALTVVSAHFPVQFIQQARQIQVVTDQQNFCYSPWSIEMALKMLLDGSKGKTNSEILNALGELPNAKSGSSAGLESANGIWINTANQKQLVPSYDKAKITPLDFSNPENARKSINNWVAMRTHQRIINLLPSRSINATSALVLANALYLKAAWKNVFDKNATKNKFFSTSEDKRVSVPMMSKSEDLLYSQGDFGQAVAIPYQSVEVLLWVILPKSNLNTFYSTLTDKTLNNILSTTSKQRVALQIPRFSIESTFSAKDTLKNKMPLAFASKADFSGIITPPPSVYVDNIFHQAKIIVDEEGTIATAATGVVMRMGAVLRQSVHFVADHPFIFLIVDSTTKDVLFWGQVANPAITDTWIDR